MHEVEAAQLRHPLLVGVGALVAAHGVDGVGGADPLEQRLAPQQLVGVGVVGGHAALVAPVDVDLPPVDLVAAVGGQPLVAAAGGVAARQRDREPSPGRSWNASITRSANSPGDVVDDDQLAVHRASAQASPGRGPRASACS